MHVIDGLEAPTEVRFRALVAEWRLGTMEVALLLGVDGSDLGLDLVAVRPAAETKERMRLLVELRGVLARLFNNGTELNEWLRTFDEDDMSPILFLSHGAANIEAVTAAVTMRLARSSR